MAQHALRGQHDQRLSPWPARLPAQHVEVLRSRGRLANLHVVFRGQLHKSFQARAGMLWALPLVTVRQKQHDSRWKIPFVLPRADELVDDHLSAVGEIPELRLPQNERLRVVAAETVF